MADCYLDDWSCKWIIWGGEQWPSLEIRGMRLKKGDTKQVEREQRQEYRSRGGEAVILYEYLIFEIQVKSVDSA